MSTALLRHHIFRTINLSSATLQEFVLDLVTILHENYWEEKVGVN